MIKIFFGEDTFRTHEALEELRREVETGDASGGVSTEIDGANAKPEELLNASQTMPLLGGQRLVIVRGLLERFDGRRGSRRKKAKDDEQETSALGDWQQVIDALPGLPESTLLVFVDGRLGAKNPMLTAVRKSADVQQFDLLGKDAKSRGQLAAWITERAELYGARLEGRATAAMADLVGGDLWTIDSELRKLATYAGDNPVSEDDVRELVSQVREANVFALADAIVEGRTDAAIKLFQQRLADGDSPLRLLALIARQYRLLILAKELQARNIGPADIGRRLGVHSFVAQRLLQQAPPYSTEQLRAAYARLLEADLSIKRGIYKEETALELLIFELASNLASRRSGRRGYNRPQAGRPRTPSAAATGSPGTR